MYKGFKTDRGSKKNFFVLLETARNSNIFKAKSRPKWTWKATNRWNQQVKKSFKEYTIKISVYFLSWHLLFSSVSLQGVEEKTVLIQESSFANEGEASTTLKNVAEASDEG